MSDWDGKSKGTVFGYRIFVFLLKNIGINAAYFLLYFVAAYYFIFLKKSNRASYYYFHNRLGYSYLKAKAMVYRNYYSLGQSIVDKIAISAGLRNRYTYEFDGIENLHELVKEKKGGILISAHMGNFEIAEYFLSDLDYDLKINLIISDLEHRAIKEYLKSIAAKSNVKFIILKDDLTHIYDINIALANNELICIVGDRYLEGVKLMRANFLGKDANFPAGPFLIASRLHAPVVFVYVMKEKNRHYHLYARTAEVKHRDEKGLLMAYLESVEGMVKKYPLQWYNYFDFWNEMPKKKIKE